MVFSIKQQIDILLPGLRLCSTNTARKFPTPTHNIVAQNHAKGFFLIATIVENLRGHIIRIDHTGINLPTAMLQRSDWSHLLNIIGKTSALYQYPTGEEWLFVIPATVDELHTDITYFIGGREPRFELVYDPSASQPTIQVSVETDFSRSEIEALFPAPFGITLPDLGDIFRSVYVANPWANMTIRFDLYYHKTSGSPSAWDTGEWLVQNGGRIKPAAGSSGRLD